MLDFHVFLAPGFMVETRSTRPPRAPDTWVALKLETWFIILLGSTKVSLYFSPAFISVELALVPGSIPLLPLSPFGSSSE